MPSLRALECLVAVADTGSITRAARVLNSSQPAVSHQLAALEREAAATLLHREARGVTLTAAGRAAVADARRAVDAAGSAVRSARAAGAATGGLLRLACAQSLTVPVLAPVIRQWHHRRGEVTITLREATRLEDFLGLVDDGEVDVALVPAPVPDHVAATVVAEEEIVLSAATDHHLARKQAVGLEDLDGVALIHFASENGLSHWLDEALARAGVRPHPVMRTSVTSAAPQLAAAGLGVAVSPLSAVSAGFVGVVRPFRPRWTRTLVAVTADPDEPLVARFLADLVSHGIRVPADVREQLAGTSPSGT